MKKLILICGLLASGLSFGADWVHVGSDSTGLKFYIDYDYYNYSKTISTVDLWYKVNKESNSKSYTSQKALTRYDCNNKKYKNLSVATYYPSGTVVDTYEHNPLASAYRMVFPDTIGEALWGVACDTPGKGLDFKYPNLEGFDDYSEYIRATYAYARAKQPQGGTSLSQLTPNIKVESYSDYIDYLIDRKKELDKIRIRNIQKYK